MNNEFSDLEKRPVSRLISQEGIEVLKYHRAKNGHFLRTPTMPVGYTLAREAGRLNFSRNDPHNLVLITDEVFKNGADFLTGSTAQSRYLFFGSGIAKKPDNQEAAPSLEVWKYDEV